MRTTQSQSTASKAIDSILRKRNVTDKISKLSAAPRALPPLRTVTFPLKLGPPSQYLQKIPSNPFPPSNLIKPALTAFTATMDSVISNATKLVQPPHPFYPLEANIVGYLANQYSTITLLGIFAAGCTAILGMTHLLVGKTNPRLPSGEKAVILWFILCELGWPWLRRMNGRGLMCWVLDCSGDYTFLLRG